MGNVSTDMQEALSGGIPIGEYPLPIKNNRYITLQDDNLTGNLEHIQVVKISPGCARIMFFASPEPGDTRPILERDSRISVFRIDGVDLRALYAAIGKCLKK